MHGPYHARVVLSDDVLVLTADDVREGSRIAEGFYQDASPGLLVGFTRAATFTVGLLLDRGERADVDIIGREGPESGSAPCQASTRGSHAGCPMCDGSGRRRAREVGAGHVSVVRVSDDTISTTLGSRWSWRKFRSPRLAEGSRS